MKFENIFTHFNVREPLCKSEDGFDFGFVDRTKCRVVDESINNDEKVSRLAHSLKVFLLCLCSLYGSRKTMPRFSSPFSTAILVSTCHDVPDKMLCCLRRRYVGLLVVSVPRGDACMPPHR